MLHVSLNQAGSRFLVHGGDPKGRDKINRIISSWPGWARVAVAGRSGVSTYAGPRSIPSALALSSTQLELEWEDSARAGASVLLKSFERARQVLEGPLSEAIAQVRSWPHERKPFRHQICAVAAILQLEGRVLLADDMGLGKTSTALWASHALSSDRTLILCPASVKFNWEAEITATLGKRAVVVIDGSKKERINQFGEMRKRFEKAKHLFVIINYDLLKHLSHEQLSMLGRFVRGRMVIMDESHYLKNHESERSQIVKRSFCPSEGGAQWRLGLTGTPIRNTVEDLYHQHELVRPGTYHSFNWFLNRFTEQSIMKVPYRKGGKTLYKTLKKVRRAKNEKELNQIVNTIQIRRLKKDVLDLPEAITTYPQLELDPHTAKVYAAMRDYALLLLEEQDDSASILSPVCRTAVEAAARCEQIAQGCVGGVPEELMPRLSATLTNHAAKVEGKPGWLVFPSASKLVHLQEGLDSVKLQDGQSVTFCRFIAPLLWLEAKRLGVAVTGSMGLKRRQEVFDAFQAGDIRELYISVRIAEGFNLYAAQDEFFLGRDWAWAINSQAVARCHRMRQTGTVNVQMPFVRGTIEVRQHSVLLQKEKDADNTLCFQTIADLKEALS